MSGTVAVAPIVGYWNVDHTLHFNTVMEYTVFMQFFRPAVLLNL